MAPFDVVEDIRSCFCTGLVLPSIDALSFQQAEEAFGQCIGHLEKQGMGAVEPISEGEEAWGNEVNEIANATLFPRTDSWWTGANIPGKPRYFSAYLGGALYYHRI